MTPDPAPKPANNLQKRARGKPFASGFDERRWMSGSKKPRVPKDVKALMDGLLWEIASEELTAPNGEKVDRLRALIRSLTTSKHSADKIHFLDRLAGKVSDKIELEAKGELKVIIEYADIEGNTPPLAPGADTDQDGTEEA
jgi:hypothetical protein